MNQKPNIMKLKNIIYVPVLLALQSNILCGQTSVEQKTFEVSNKAKKGFIESIELNKEKGTIDLMYTLPTGSSSKRDNFLGVTRATMGGNIKYEIYSYDKDLNQTGVSREEERAYKVRYPEYQYTTLQPTMKLTCLCLAFQNVETKASYNWYSGYKKTVKYLEKTKAESENGASYSFTGRYYDLFSTRSILTLAGKKVKKNSAYPFLHYTILNVNNNTVAIEETDSINFQYMNNTIWSGPVSDDQDLTNDESPRDWVIMFAPMKIKGDPKPNNLTYLRVSPKGKILEKVSIESPSNGWNIEGVYEHGGHTYVYGSAVTKAPTEKYYEEVVKKGWEEITLTNYQIASITAGKLDYVSSPSFADMQAQQAKPANQKKPLELNGEECITTGIKVLETGDVLITFQDYQTKGAPAKQGGNYKHQKGVSLFHFDPKGTFKKHYGVDLNPDPNDVDKFSTSVWEIPAKHDLFLSADGKKLHWMITYVKDVICIGEANAEMNDIECKPLNTVEYGTIDLASGEISEYKQLGYDKKNPFYLFGKTGAYKWDNFVYFFGETEKGDKMMLSKLDISK
jgi:hypothetical protein